MRMLFALTIAFLIAFFTCAHAFCRQIDFEAFVNEHWHAIKEVSGDLNDPQPDYWYLISMECQKHFIALAQHDDRANTLRCFLRKFGQDGALADIRWLLSAPELLLLNDRNSSGNAEYDQLQEEIASIQTELLLEDRKLLHRYFEMNVYLTAYFGRENNIFRFDVFANRTANKLIHKTSTSPCRDTRNALLIVYATGRDDLLEDPERFISNVDAVMADWSKWFEVYHPFLEVDEEMHRWRGRLDFNRTDPDIPALSKCLRAPFADWPTDTTPPSFEGVKSVISKGGILSTFIQR